jgi:hypothetical protein
MASGPPGTFAKGSSVIPMWLSRGAGLAGAIVVSGPMLGCTNGVGLAAGPVVVAGAAVCVGAVEGFADWHAASATASATAAAAADARIGRPERVVIGGM